MLPYPTYENYSYNQAVRNNILFLTFKRSKMKNIRIPMLCLCIVTFQLCVTAQESHPLAPKTDLNKPKIFNALPERIKVSLVALDALIEKQTGNTTSVETLMDNQVLRFEGSILFSVNDVQSKLKSIMLQLPSFGGARFTLTQLTHADGTKEYAGRILSFQHGDAYILEKHKDDYYLIKKNFYDLVNE